MGVLVVSLGGRSDGIQRSYPDPIGSLMLAYHIPGLSRDTDRSRRRSIDLLDISVAQVGRFRVVGRDNV